MVARGRPRSQFSRDLRQSYTNTSDTLIKIPDIIDGIGRSDLLPRATREHRAQLAETLSLDTSRHSFKFGGDSLKEVARNLNGYLKGMPR